MKKYIMAAALVMGFAAAANAQENKLVVKPSGRILMDAALRSSVRLPERYVFELQGLYGGA